MGYDISLTHEDTPGNFIGNITYNVDQMYNKAFGEYWRDVINNKVANDVLELMNKAIDNMERSPNDYKKLEPDNGWGDYDTALTFLKEFYDECKTYPKMLIYIG